MINDFIDKSLNSCSYKIENSSTLCFQFVEIVPHILMAVMKRKK